MKNCLRFFVLVSFLAAIASAAENVWITDMTMAKQKAAAGNKDILIYITGSDWCGFCKRLRKNVFNQEMFIEQMSKCFVMVEMDFPHDDQKKAAQSAELKKQNKEWRKKLKSRGYPNVFLVDEIGKPYARQVGYSNQTLKQYIGILKKLRQIRIIRDKYLKLANEAKEPAEIAGLLDKSLSEMDTEIIVNHYLDMVKRIGELDSRNKLGLKKKYHYLPKVVELKDQITIAARKKDFEKLNSMVKRLMKIVGGKGQDAQEALFHQAYALREVRPEVAKKVFRTALQADPNGRLVEKIKSSMKRL
jgi:thioredoxin-related protein